MTRRFELYREFEVYQDDTTGEWCATHEDYDGAEDAEDDRHLSGFHRRQDAKAAVDDYWWERR